MNLPIKLASLSDLLCIQLWIPNTEDNTSKGRYEDIILLPKKVASANSRFKKYEIHKCVNSFRVHKQVHKTFIHMTNVDMHSMHNWALAPQSMGLQSTVQRENYSVKRIGSRLSSQRAIEMNSFLVSDGKCFRHEFILLWNLRVCFYASLYPSTQIHMINYLFTDNELLFLI